MLTIENASIKMQSIPHSVEHANFLLGAVAVSHLHNTPPGEFFSRILFWIPPIYLGKYTEVGFNR